MTTRDDPEVEIVDLLLKRSPGLSLDELTDVLTKVGVTAQGVRLGQLLARTGHEVVTGDDGRDVVRPMPVPTPSTRPSGGQNGSGSAAPPGARPGPARGSRPPFPANPSAVVAVTMVALLVLVIVGVTIVRHDNAKDDNSPTAASTLPTGTTAPATSAGPTTTKPKAKGPVKVAPTGPGSDPKLAVAGALTDLFSTTGSLGTGPSGQTWKVWRGNWTAISGVANVSGGGSGGLNLASIDIGTPDVRAQVTLTKNEAGSALAFRVIDSENYWMIASAPNFGTFTVIEVVGGKPKYRANSGVAKAGPGTTIGVNAVGSSIDIYLNGAVVAHATDATPTGDSIGLATAVKEHTASFSHLVYLKASS